MNLFVKSSLALCAVLCASSCWATTVSEAETAAAARWCDRYVRGTTAAEPSGLVVVRNNDPVIRNEMPGGRGPLKVGGKDYNRGLNCHADSKVIVKVGKKCKRFESVAGIDDRNHDYSSIVLSVEANGKELYNSGLLRHDTKTFVDVNVDLGGATEFAILAGDGGDNISFDWAD
ncbi:MAG: NPCBM/NEW2 domain-containing protein, partial [Abditibacteriota bacterium]|nr:NPCBM/NEW2 domain-containing protein [Abditibacteriota bacterium]